MSLQGGIELRKPELPAEADNKQASYLRAAMDPDMLTRCEATIQEWMVQTEGLLAETEGTRKEPDDAGPDTELVFWRNRMAKFNGVAEQLKSKEARFVLGVAQTAKSQRYKHWKAVDNAITDALNEAKDNVKYLAAPRPARSDPPPSAGRRPSRPHPVGTWPARLPAPSAGGQRRRWRSQLSLPQPYRVRESARAANGGGAGRAVRADALFHGSSEPRRSIFACDANEEQALRALLGPVH